MDFTRLRRIECFPWWTTFEPLYLLWQTRKYSKILVPLFGTRKGYGFITKTLTFGKSKNVLAGCVGWLPVCYAPGRIKRVGRCEHPEVDFGLNDILKSSA